jgi:hypothetical protein
MGGVRSADREANHVAPRCGLFAKRSLRLPFAYGSAANMTLGWLMTFAVYQPSCPVTPVDDQAG